MSVILDPSRDGLSVIYDGKIRNLVGDVEDCIDWVIDICCDKFEWSSSKDLYGKDNLFNYHGETWEKLSEIYVDINGIGQMYVDYLDKVGIEFKKLDVKRIDFKR